MSHREGGDLPVESKACGLNSAVDAHFTKRSTDSLRCLRAKASGQKDANDGSNVVIADRTAFELWSFRSMIALQTSLNRGTMKSPGCCHSGCRVSDKD